ncbi:MAG TPA: aldo/keto reductase, partial [Nocardioides sp.]|nr:aldo/keto reductase [Nocardioides sp.]
MTYRPLGDSGLMVSAVGVGCNAFGRRIGLDAVRGIVDAADESGVTLLDTSDSYSIGQSEEMIGVVLEGRRDRFVVATKFGSDMRGTNGPDFGARGARSYVRRAVEASLKRLRTDRIDLYQLHFPDPITPIEETLSVLTDLVREGKVGYLGCSNLRGWQVADAEWTARTRNLHRFISAQNEYSWLNR